MTSILKAVSLPSNNNGLILLILTMICVIVPLDLTQLIFACLGAFCYYVVQHLQSNGPSAKKKILEEPEAAKKRRPARKQMKGAHVDKEAQTPTVPIVAPTFHGESLEEEVQELITQILPTAASQRGVDRLAEAIRVMLAGSLPEVEVLGFCSSDLARGRANGVAVPDVDIVINVSPERVASKLSKDKSLDVRMLQKWALRSCADRLVSGGFKFRRSGFRGSEPKMTLLVPPELKLFPEAVAIDIAVNAVTPLHGAAVLTESGNINPQSKELILLVRRWAKDRGVCHAPKGHLSPYLWSLLVVYYLQVREEPLLPPMESFEAISKLLPERRSASRKEYPRVPAAELLKGFMRFYKSFDWKEEAICVLRGTKGPAPLSLPIHVIEQEDKTMECGPNIEDPFSKVNLGTCMTWWSFRRMKEELARACELLGQEMSLTKLLEPWSPEA